MLNRLKKPTPDSQEELVGLEINIRGSQGQMRLQMSEAQMKAIANGARNLFLGLLTAGLTGAYTLRGPEPPPLTTGNPLEACQPQEDQ